MMELSAKPGLPAQLVAAVDWWRDAGVDCTFRDEPANWITLPEPAKPAAVAEAKPAPFAPVPAEAPAPAIARDGMPQDLAAFSAWWLTEPSLDNGRTEGRVPPRGRADAAVMILVPQPEKEDRETLLSGPQGKLLDAMLEAMGIAPGDACVASVLPRHTPHADWAAIGAQGMGEVLVHHIRLAAPRGLIAFGSLILPLLGHDPAKTTDILRTFNHEGGNVPLLAARDLDDMLRRPRWKADFWTSWLDWAGRDATRD